MDEKAEEIIAPFRDWDISELKFERVMLAIDAIVESKIEKLKNEMNAKIQKLQIEKTFPPKNNNVTENDEEACKEIEKEIDLQICTEENEEEETKKTIDKHSKHPYSKITSVAVDDVRKELEKDYVTQLNLLVGKNYDTYKNNYTITVPVNFKHFKHILRQKIKKLIKASSENKIITFDRFKNEDNYNTFCLNTVFSYKPESYSINTYINYCDRYRLTLHSKERSNTFNLKYHEDCVIIHGNDSNYNFMIYDPLTNEYTLFVNSETMVEENYLS